MNPHHRWLHGELPALLRDGVLSEEQANALRERFALGEEKSKLAAILPGVGMLLVGVGVLVVFGERWDQFSQTTRSLLALAPTALAFAYDRWAGSQEGAGASGQREASAASLVLGAAATMALLRSTWGIDVSAARLTFFAAALTLVVAWQRRVTGLHLAYPLLVAQFAMSDGGQHRGAVTLLAAAMLVAAAPALRARTVSALASRWLASGYAVATLVVVMKASMDANAPPTVALASWVLGAHALSILALDSAREPFRLLGLYVRVAALPLLLILGFREAWSTADGAIATLREPSMESLALSLSMVAPWALAAGVLVRRSQLEARLDAPVAALAFIVVAGTFAADNGVSRDILRMVMILLTAAWGLERVRTGVVTSRIGELNFGLVLSLGLVLVQVAGTNLGAVVKGLLFIAAGVAFLLVNRSVLARQRP
jgi:hypothetical protein